VTRIAGESRGRGHNSFGLPCFGIGGSDFLNSFSSDPMTKSYTQIQKQIKNLQQEAERVRRKEVQGVIGRIKEAIAAYGLTASDLGLEAAARGKSSVERRGPAGKAEPGAAKRAKVPKFRDEAGHTWGGRGPRPKWLRDALTAGKALEDFAV
jgi:DNA-binding protein H-NS